MDLLHALSWDSILAALAPAASVEGKLDDEVQQWATQLTILALQCMVLSPEGLLPPWLQNLVQPLGQQALLTPLATFD